MLGPLGAVGDDGPVALGGAKQRAVLAHLLLRANRVVAADRLIDDVWEDDPPAAARNVLQTYVSRLRKVLGDERLERRSGGYLLHAEPGELDADRFRSLVAEARRRAVTDPAAASALYREADALWRGPALDDLADQPSLRPRSPTSRNCGPPRRRTASSPSSHLDATPTSSPSSRIRSGSSRCARCCGRT